MSTVSAAPSTARRQWIPVALLFFIGATVGGLRLFGVLLILALAYYVICLVRPAAGLAWAFAALTLAEPEFLVANVHVHAFELMVWPACLLFLASQVARHRFLSATDLRRLAPLLLMGGYPLVACLLLWGPTAPLEIRMWGSALLFAVACYLGAGDSDFRRHLTRAMATSAVALCALALSQHFLGGPGYLGFEEPRDLLQLLFTGRAEPVRLANLTFEHFNSAGAYLSIVVGVLFGASLSRTGTRVVRLATLAALLALYLTYSRGAATAILVGMAAAAYWLLRPSWRIALILGGLAVIALAAIVLIPILFSTEYATTFALGSRALIWAAYVQAWRVSPVFGLGPGDGYAMAQFLSPFGDEYAAHNNYLYIAADYGAVGVLILVGGVVITLHRITRVPGDERRLHPYSLAALAAAVAFLVHSMVDHTLVVFSYRIGLFGLLAVALRTYSQRESAT